MSRLHGGRPAGGCRLLFATILVLVLSAVLTAPVRAQFSPGPLSRAHQDLDGTLSCTKCHELGVGKGPTDARCLDCHKALRGRIDAGAGFHARSGRNEGCVRCHSEHNGRDFDLVGLDRANFDHAETGHPLAGKHVTLACEKCHRAPVGFLGLDGSCVACHTDPHKGQLGIECTGCHGEEAWKPATGFDHGKTHYPLTGSHETVPCSKCHAAGRYKGLPFDDCADCHTSPHSAVFEAGRACATCHATAGWSEGASIGFDHSRTPFSLEGAHQRVACAGCHKGGRFRVLGGSTCESCHADPHKGQFADEGKGCVDCHAESTWRPAGRFDHGATRYPLTGAHERVACGRCHPEGRYAGAPTACAGCHLDPHRGDLGPDCAHCHAPVAWAETVFDHGTTKFPLSGKHASSACRRCHGAKSEARYRRLDPACGACHADPHRAQFLTRYPEASKSVERLRPPAATRADSVSFAPVSGEWDSLPRTGCALCHLAAAWKPSTYDHRQSSFVLEGKHAGVECARCHKDGAFAKTPVECSSCHNDPHWGQFTGLSCDECHSARGWAEVRFDHRGTLFQLAGRHAELACSACHGEGRFRGLSPRCGDCHEDAHLQALGASCERCHTARSWTPSTFEHGIDIFPLWGAHQAVDCASCHRDEVTWQVDAPPRECIDCHDREFRQAPAVIHMQAGPDCERCHGFDEWRGAHDDAWFNIRTGQHRGVACTRCHDLAPDYPDYTCDACHHGHDDGRRRCLECHPHGFGD